MYLPPLSAGEEKEPDAVQMMPLEKQVASLELSKRLKELGYPQEGLFWWRQYEVEGRKFSTLLQQERLPLNWQKDEDNLTVYAPTVAELGEMLPTDNYEIYLGKESRQYHIGFHKGLAVTASNNSYSIADTEADARAKMLIYLLENKLITLN